MMSKSFSCAAVLSLLACLPAVSRAEVVGSVIIDTSHDDHHRVFDRQASALQTTGTDATNYLHMVPLLDGARAWTNLPDAARFLSPPEFLKHLMTTMASWALFPGTSVTFSCPNAPKDIDVCDAWIFYYTCSECNTQNPFGAAGGLAAALAIDPDWEGVTCAPSFTNGYSDAVHPMRAFRRQLAPGDSAEVILPGVAEFLAFGIDGRAINCEGPAYNTVDTCDTPATEGRCKWEGGVCKNQNCARHGQGPAKPCPSPCPSDEPRSALGK